jgi:hypothetical protein
LVNPGHFLWLLARGMTATAVAALTGYSAYWIGQIPQRYNTEGPDGVVRVTPSDSASAVIKVCKGVTSFYLRREFPHLMKLPFMWTRSAFSSTADNVSQEMIRTYIAAQTGR